MVTPGTAATRPWQHVLDPLGGYLLLAERLSADPSLADGFNFGPQLEVNRSVRGWWRRPSAIGPEAGRITAIPRPPTRQACSTL